jgi:hypothetical protein
MVFSVLISMDAVNVMAASILTSTEKTIFEVLAKHRTAP